MRMKKAVVCSKKAVICGIVIVSFLFVHSPVIAQGSKKVTQNTPQIKTTTPEPIAAGKAGGSKKKVLWGVLGAAAVIGLLAAVVGGGSGGSGGSSGGLGDDAPSDEDNGSVQVEW